MDLNTATFEEMQSLAGIGNGRAQTIFVWRANLSKPLTLLDLLEMGIPADVVKALIDNLEIKATPPHEEQDGGIVKYNRWLLLLWHHVRELPVM